MKKPIKLILYITLPAIPCLFYSFVIKTDRSISLSIAKTEAGMVSGIRDSSGDVTAFKGIPFAAPPVGNLRWRAPEAAKHWKGVKKCDIFGPSPMQGEPVPVQMYTAEFLIPEKPISEDCLYLNVWTNAIKKTDKNPVFVWIYGGGFGGGGSACSIYDGEALAKKGIVFVSINYRVGAFGFLAHPLLSKESPDKSSGNYGLLDQIAALKWLKRNIAAFGGDPGNVTIAGQSAGAMSISCLFASPLAKGLFNKAIAESGSLIVNNPVFVLTDLRTAEEKGKSAAESAGVYTLAQLRAMSAGEVMEKFQRIYAPIVDGVVLPGPVSAIFARNKQIHLPLLTGWNADEGSGTMNKNDYKKQVEDEYGANAADFLRYFPGETDEQAAKSQIEINRNKMFALSVYKWAVLQSKYDDSPVYLYNFNRKVPENDDLAKYGAFHTAEVPYTMNNLRLLSNRPLKPEDYSLAGTMSDYWVNFVKSGNPNGPGLPNWPQYNTSNNLIEVFDKDVQTIRVPNQNGLDFILTMSGK